MRKLLCATLALLLWAGAASAGNPLTPGWGLPQLQDTRIFGPMGAQGGILSPNTDGSINTKNVSPGIAVSNVTSCGGANVQSNASVVAPAGLFVYVVSMWASAEQDTTGAAIANKFYTSTNLHSFEQLVNMPAGPSTTLNFGPWAFNPPLKSDAPGVVTNWKSPAAQADTYYCTGFAYYFGP